MVVHEHFSQLVNFQVTFAVSKLLLTFRSTVYHANGTRNTQRVMFTPGLQTWLHQSGPRKVQNICCWSCWLDNTCLCEGWIYLLLESGTQPSQAFSTNLNKGYYKPINKLENNWKRKRTCYFFLVFLGQWGWGTFGASAFVGMLAATISSTIESIGDYLATAPACGLPRPPSHAINRYGGF